jgi:coiled-coil domain-containing protein 12
LSFTHYFEFELLLKFPNCLLQEQQLRCWYHLLNLLSEAMSSTNTALSAASQDRKARLAQLRSLKRKQPEPSNDFEPRTENDEAAAGTAQEEDDIKKKYLSGRNFDHSTGGAKLGFEHAPDQDHDTIERKAEILAEKVLEEAKEAEKRDEPLDLFKLQPKKPNWDLKRDLKQRMEVLDVRTENAIARLVRERIEGQKKQASNGVEGAGLEGADLVEAVHIREREEIEEQRREKEWEEGLADGGP